MSVFFFALLVGDRDRVVLNMTRGNQRDLARAKNLKKQQEVQKKKGGVDSLTLEQRKQRDAELMREKQKKKEEDANKS